MSATYDRNIDQNEVIAIERRGPNDVTTSTSTSKDKRSRQITVFRRHLPMILSSPGSKETSANNSIFSNSLEVCRGRGREAQAADGDQRVW